MAHLTTNTLCMYHQVLYLFSSKVNVSAMI